jgi:uncharacterized OB-fold protein
VSAVPEAPTAAAGSANSGAGRAAKKYVPSPEGLNLLFHRGAIETGMLHLQRCAECGLHRHPPRWYCPSCHSDRWAFEPVSGRGHIYSMAVNHFTVDRAWIDEVPFVTAVVELLEGPRVVGAVRGLTPEQVEIGLAVVVTPEPRGEEFAFLWVDPVET